MPPALSITAFAPLSLFRHFYLFLSAPFNLIYAFSNRMRQRLSTPMPVIPVATLDFHAVDYSDNTVIFEENTWERRLSVRKYTVIKRAVNASELLVRSNGASVYPYWASERLLNEAATLAFIAEKTTIPVPKARLYYSEGMLHLESIRITSGVMLDTITDHRQPAAIAAVDAQMQQTILPQLHAFRRNNIGSLAGLPVFPPSRVHSMDRRSWKRITANANDFVLCHNDLSPRNILVNPSDNYHIVGIIDWEYAGFFPADFELPLWRALNREEKNAMMRGAKERDLAFWGLTPADIQNNCDDKPSWLQAAT
ncbi:hypothetical protein LOZ12_002875 [Ophidiomyces ophidiicola]|uniref:Uncharacterized protein n=1 Tax=Ophidiomyces ophidiicola TaxID=1387563 RepID=A0ACB8V078_9EURO|nr:hypothetical protein LOZ64_000535 [Ophidiomyces ophidiicola]KAI1948616.1 hypothetical protein LOZ62_002693 [Ophidiomyces ophidiicola]KAI1958304.1 hypothetical protein LOZ59_003501 [Ophidiomyces ophidiicola]KAI1968715.1 hypothetical protein LOZ56_004873 [Ophidiomyces ophidiicola]KAI2023006.1 hypothetical protein LOZ46_001726 [Ophidiomyces ophidiicola]